MQKIQLINPMDNAKLYRYPQGNITQLFGENPNLYAFMNLKGHNGWDIYMPYGTPVRAVCRARVVDIKEDPTGFGKHVRIITDLIDDYYYEITFGHLSEIKTKVGNWVIAGDIIGLCGNTGFVVSGGTAYWKGYNPDNKGTHLHIGIRKLTVPKSGYNSAIISYPLDKYGYNVEDYNNGMKGAIDPLPFFEDEIKRQAVSLIELVKRFIAEFSNFMKNKFTGTANSTPEAILSNIPKVAIKVKKGRKLTKRK